VRRTLKAFPDARGYGGCVALRRYDADMTPAEVINKMMRSGRRRRAGGGEVDAGGPLRRRSALVHRRTLLRVSFLSHSPSDRGGSFE